MVVFQNNALTNLDVGVDATGKLITGASGSLQADEIIDVSGKVISPGFIDILADNAANPMRTIRSLKVQGERRRDYRIADAWRFCYHDFLLQFFQSLSPPHQLWCIHGRDAGALSHEATPLSGEDGGAMSGGGVGCIAQHRIPAPPYDEVLTYARLAKKYDRPFFLHLPLLQHRAGVGWCERKRSGLPARAAPDVHIDHLHSTGGTFHMADALTLIRRANKGRVDDDMLCLSYSFWATCIRSASMTAGRNDTTNLQRPAPGRHR